MDPAPDSPPPAAVTMPPLASILLIQKALDQQGINNVVGGSGLLASLGLITEVNDWDLVVDAEPADVEQLFGELGLPHRRKARSGIFRTDAAIEVDAGDHSIDVLVGFALDSAEGVTRIPARAGERWRGLQMARAEDWEQAYRLLGREQQALLLAEHLMVRRSPRQDSNLRHPL